MKRPQDLDRKSVFVIVPSYNEQKVIAATLKPLIEAGYSVVVVDDGSSDRTPSIVGRLTVHYLRHPINLGQGAALQTGIDYALRKGAEIIVTFDADGQHRPQDILSLIEPIQKGEADVVLGSRFLRYEHKKDVPLGKRILLKGAILVNILLTGVWLSDAHNGLRALSRQAAEQIRLRENRYAHASEIMIQIRNLKLKHVEVPTRVRYSNYSKSKGQSFWNAFNIMIDLLLRRIYK